MDTECAIWREIYLNERIVVITMIAKVIIKFSEVEATKSSTVEFPLATASTQTIDNTTLDFVYAVNFLLAAFLYVHHSFLSILNL